MIRRSTFDTNFKLDEEHKSEAAKDSYHVSINVYFYVLAIFKPDQLYLVSIISIYFDLKRNL